MPQSSVVFFFLFAGFLVYITTKGELPVYLGILTGSVNSSGGGGSNPFAGAGSSSPIPGSGLPGSDTSGGDFSGLPGSGDSGGIIPDNIPTEFISPGGSGGGFDTGF